MRSTEFTKCHKSYRAAVLGLYRTSMLTNILYSYDGTFGPNLPNRLQIIRYYENAIHKLGGKTVHANSKKDAWVGVTFYLEISDEHYWILIYDLIYNPVDQYSLSVLSEEE